MLIVEIISKIRRYYFVKGLGVKTISRQLGRIMVSVNESGMYALVMRSSMRSNQAISQIGYIRSPANYSQNFLYQKHVI